ncbi:unnamed protein product [Calicophoron daubneyi]|uniref:Uncharacterized protein n=1 Tax=Calicophoron daubneyi TaxID=300641 RepID=A0AAV2TXF8_CALDB
MNESRLRFLITARFHELHQESDVSPILRASNELGSFAEDSHQLMSQESTTAETVQTSFPNHNLFGGCGVPTENNQGKKDKSSGMEDEITFVGTPLIAAGVEEDENEKLDGDLKHTKDNDSSILPNGTQSTRILSTPLSQRVTETASDLFCVSPIRDSVRSPERTKRIRPSSNSVKKHRSFKQTNGRRVPDENRTSESLPYVKSAEGYQTQYTSTLAVQPAPLLCNASVCLINSSDTEELTSDIPKEKLWTQERQDSSFEKPPMQAYNSSSSAATLDSSNQTNNRATQGLFEPEAVRDELKITGVLPNSSFSPSNGYSHPDSTRTSNEFEDSLDEAPPSLCVKQYPLDQDYENWKESKTKTVGDISLLDVGINARFGSFLALDL